mgnify:CR=1 FL=1
MKQSKSPPSLWWQSLGDDCECAITLEPINELPYPPFVLYRHNAGEPKSAGHAEDDYYFDGKALASYIVSRGMFQNPLTREPLTWDDCRRLDQYLDDYGQSLMKGGAQSGQKRIQVLEAFALRESIQIKNPGGVTATNNNNVHQEALQRRSDYLRSEATSALAGLFTYNNHHHSSDNNGSGAGHRRRRNRRQENQNQQPQATATTATSFSSVLGNQRQEPPPVFGFNLNASDPSRSNTVDGDDDGYGMVVIDDNDQVRQESIQHTYQQLQEAFPRLSTQEHNTDSNTTTGPVVALPDPSKLEFIKRQAELDRQQEIVRQHALQYARQQLEREALQRKHQRQEEKQIAMAQAKDTLLQRQQEAEETAKARAEIEKWREKQWEQMTRMAQAQKEQTEQQEKAREERERQEQLERERQAQELAEKQQQEEQEQAALEQEEKQKEAKAAKRKRARDRKKAQKALDQQEHEKRNKEAALQAQKESSTKRCAACQGGIIGFPFEKFGNEFCSTSCARAGPHNED